MPAAPNVPHSSRVDDDLTDELLANLIVDVAQDVLANIGNDPEARYQFFRAFIDLAKRTANGHVAGPSGRLCDKRVQQFADGYGEKQWLKQRRRQ